MMARVSEIAGHWLGLCRKPPLNRVSHAAFVTLPESSCTGLPEGGAGSGAIRRGLGAALIGMKTLNRNRQLLWFTLLAGLVLGGNIVCQGALFYLSWITSGGIVSQALGFFLGFATLFCLVFLLVGLVLSISSKNERTVSFFGKLARATNYLKAIFLWSLILAIVSSLLDILFFSSTGFFRPPGSYLPLTQFPFTLNLNPSTFAEVPGYGGRSVLFWTYPYGFMQAVTFSATCLLLFLLTPFVVPAIVLGHRTLMEAVGESFTSLKKIWAGVVACAVFLGVIVTAVFLTYILVQAAHGIFTPPAMLYDRPSDLWVAVGLLYYLALFSVTGMMATVGGIASLDLYKDAKTRGGA